MVVVVSAACTFGLCAATFGLSIYVPGLVALGVVQLPGPALVVGNVLPPLAVAVFARRRWWVRWCAVGVLSCNVALLVYIAHKYGLQSIIG